MNQHQNGRTRQPPTAGAVDLDALRRRPSEEQHATAVQQALIANGLRCPCGERIRDTAVELHFIATTEVNTAAGPQAACGMGHTTFCHADCDALREVIANAPSTPGAQPQPIALRGCPPVVWLDELLHTPPGS